MQPKATTVKRDRFSILRIIVSLAILAIAIWLFFNRQLVLDEVALRRFEPSNEIVTLAESTSMTDTGKRYFYASRPQLDESIAFNEHCNAENEQSIILGCYSIQRIYLFNVTDDRLVGVKEVTAAHEMLHAAYDRLSANEKRRINVLLENQARVVKNERVLELIESYKKSEPSQINNELHSIFGTELKQLDTELEAYYKRYFTDRSKVVRYAEEYESVFSGLKASQAQLDKELNDLNKQIGKQSNQLNAEIQSLNRGIASFNERASNGGFKTQAEFNAERSQLVSRQQRLNSERNNINQLIDRYNLVREQLLALGAQADELNKALDSTPEEIPSI